MIRRIHVNRSVIDSNRKHGKNDPVLTVKTFKSASHKTHIDNTYGHEVEILGPSKLVHRPYDPMSCGAKVWIETESEVIVT